MTILARPAPLNESATSDHNACGPIAVAAVLDALGLPTDWTTMRTDAGGDIGGTNGAQLVVAAKDRDPSVIAYQTFDSPANAIAKAIPLGHYVLVAGYCYGNAEPALSGNAAAKHWFIEYGTEWQTCNIWTGVYPTYPNLGASYVPALGCVVIGRDGTIGDEMPLTLFYAKDAPNPAINAGFLGDGISCRWLRNAQQVTDAIAIFKPVLWDTAANPVGDPGAFGSPIDAETAAQQGIPFTGGQQGIQGLPGKDGKPGAPGVAAPHKHSVATDTSTV